MEPSLVDHNRLVATDPDMSERDWWEWHSPYDEPGSYLARRLAAVQGLIRDALDRVHPGPIEVLSLCAGQGRDLLGVLAEHERADDVTARLVELDERNVVLARAGAEKSRGTVEVMQADAGTTDACEGAVPADLVLLCGIFGNVPDADIRATVHAAPQLCAPGATVIWTRHRRHPDLTPEVRSWFVATGFEEVAWIAPDDTLFGVGAHRLLGEPQPFWPGARLFRFLDTAPTGRSDGGEKAQDTRTS